MQINYKYFISSILLCIWTTVGWAQTAQTPKLNFTLTNIESGTKDYVAREFIVLGNGFVYSATPGQSFIARIDKTIDIKLPDGTVITPDGIHKKPDGTIIKPDGTLVKPDGTIITSEGTVYKTDGTVINPDGTLLDISLIVPEVWFKTIPVTSDINGMYKWKDFSSNNVPLVKYSTDGTSTEYTAGRESVMNFNFNPAIDLSVGNNSKEIIVGKSNLAQATIIGAWGSKKETTNADKFIFALNGRRNESIIFSKSNVYPSVESGKNALSYGNDTIKNLLCQASSTTSTNKARENSLRIACYYKSNKPNTTLWSEQQNSTISLGSSFLSSNTNNTSTFSSTLNNFEGFKGYTPELLVFGKVLQPAERSVFESYLALKYGVSMDKSYLSGTGRVIWDYSSNTTYNNRITGYGREDILSLNQRMATTSYQEAPYYSDSYDSYLTNNANNLSASNRLLVMGCQAENPLNNGQYVLFGDDNSPITAINSSLAGYITMQRKWLVNANTTSNNWVELSYFDSLATGFANHKTDTYLIIDRSGTGNFTNMEYLLGNGTDVTRSKILFSNIIWSGKDVFTFGYKKPNLVKRDPNSNDPESTDEKSSLLIYYKDMRDISMVTVKLKLIKPSASTVLMYDMMGRLIYKTDLPSSAEVQLLDIKLPTTGVYIVKAITPKGELSAKVISKIGR